MTELKKKIAKGATWMVFFKFAERGLGLISTLILARLLIPSDFGLIALAMSLIAALELLGAFGFDMALIQNQNAERRHYDTAWTFNVLFGVFSACTLMLLAAPAAEFFNEPRLDTVMYALALSSFIQGWENIGVVAFRKELEFHKEFRFLVGKKLVSFCVTVPLAFWLQNYWALVFGILSGRLAGLLLSYLTHAYRPRLSLSAWKELFHFSKWLLINNLFHFLRTRAADFIVSKLAGSHSLGVYNVAYEISNLPTTDLIAPINRAVFPGYSKMSHDLKILKDGFLSIMGMIVLLAMPAGIGIAAVAEPLVAVVLGEKWAETAPLMVPLAFFGVLTAMQTNATYIYLAMGKPKISTYLAGANLVVLLPLLIWATKEYGIIGSSWAFLATAVMFTPLSLFVIYHHLKLSFAELLAPFWRPVLASGCMYWAVGYVIDLPLFANAGKDTSLDSAAQLTAGVATGALTYVLVTLSLWLLAGRPHSAERYLLDRVFSARAAQATQKVNS